MNKIHARRFDRLLAAMRQEDQTLIKLDIGFNMGPVFDSTGILYKDKTGNGCGTVACIAGTAALLSCKSTNERKKMLRLDGLGAVDMWSIAREWLGLNVFEASALFAGDGYRGKTLEGVTLKTAIRAVERFVATGKISFR